MTPASRGPITKACEVCDAPYRCETKRRHTARFCSMACTRAARRTGMVSVQRQTYRGAALRHWTAAEEQEIRDRYGTDGPRVLAARFGVTQRAISCKARRLGVSKPGGRRWTQREDAWLRENVRDLAYAELAARLKRSAVSVKIRVKNLGLRRVVTSGMLTPALLAEILGMSRDAVYRWIGEGRIPTKQLDVPRRNGIHTIDPWDVRWFIHENPLAVDLRKVNQELFLALVLGDLTPRLEVARLGEEMEAVG